VTDTNDPSFLPTGVPAGPACDAARSKLLDLDVPSHEHASLLATLRHVETCTDCQAAMAEYDWIRATLAPRDVQPISDTAAPTQLKMPPHNRWRIATRSAAVAAGVLIAAVIGFALGHHDRPSEPTAVAATFSPGEVSRQAAAFSEVSAAFDHRADWVLVSDSAADVGLANTPQPQTQNGVLLLRLTVARRRGSGEKPASVADLAILPGRTARLSLPFPGGRTLQYDVSAGKGVPTRIMLRAELLAGDGHSSESLAALATTLDLNPDTAASAGRFVTGTNEYEVSIAFSKLPPESAVQ